MPKCIGQCSKFKIKLEGILHLMIARQAFQTFQAFQEFQAHFKSFKRQQLVSRAFQEVSRDSKSFKSAFQE